MKKETFKAESKRLMELMINSIYSNKEIFLRELLSNASDAIDKYHYLSLKGEAPAREYQISLAIDQAARQLIIQDNGIGMNQQELKENLGTIAHSGSREFIKQVEDGEAGDIIGRFGVGFYSAFMVAKQIDVYTKSASSAEGYHFASTGGEFYTITPSNEITEGTKIVLTLKDDNEENDYSEYLSPDHIANLVKKYSDYIRYPIKMAMTITDDKDQETSEVKTLNSMIPLWNKKKNEVSDEEKNDFYRGRYYDFEPPLVATMLNVEGLVNYRGIYYIPSKLPYDIYSGRYEKGLELYSRGVFIINRCKELIPDYLKFVRGVIESPDLSLNISREILQQSKEIEKIASSVEKKILRDLEAMMKDDREKYLGFFHTFGRYLKVGIYEDFGFRKASLENLLLFATLDGKKISLKEYVAEKKEEQKEIYYAAGQSEASLLALPQMEMIKAKGYQCLLLTEDIDEFMIMVMREYEGLPFKSVNSLDTSFLSEEEAQKIDAEQKEKEVLLNKLQEILKDDVSQVILSKRLTTAPVCLVAGQGLSINMEQVLKNNPDQEAKAEKILELNPHHPLLKAVEKVFVTDPDHLPDLAHLLLDQAYLIEGLPLRNPVDFSKRLADLMIKATSI